MNIQGFREEGVRVDQPQEQNKSFRGRAFSSVDRMTNVFFLSYGITKISQLGFNSVLPNIEGRIIDRKEMVGINIEIIRENLRYLKSQLNIDQGLSESDFRVFQNLHSFCLNHREALIKYKIEEGYTVEEAKNFVTKMLTLFKSGKSQEEQLVFLEKEHSFGLMNYFPFLSAYKLSKSVLGLSDKEAMTLTKSLLVLGCLSYDYSNNGINEVMTSLLTASAMPLAINIAKKVASFACNFFKKEQAQAQEVEESSDEDDSDEDESDVESEETPQFQPPASAAPAV